MKIPNLVYDPSKGYDVDRPLTCDFNPKAYATKKEAAKALRDSLGRLAESLGDTDDSVLLFSPTRSKDFGGGEALWTVIWESGPYSWACGVFASGPWGHCETYYGFDLQLTE